MDVVDVDALRASTPSVQGPVCVLVPPATGDPLAEVAERLGIDAAAVERTRRSTHRRPLARVDDGSVSVVAFATPDAGGLVEVHFHVGERGLLVLCPEPVEGSIRSAVAQVEGSPGEALAASLVALARLSEEAVDALAEVVLALDAGGAGLTSGAVRRSISRTRGQLFGLQQLWRAHAQVLWSDDTLAEALPTAARRRLRAVHGIYESASTAAGQLYALLGDTLSRQATVISERLTLAAVVFLPLTVSTGFFGMNFGWMTRHIGSPAAFLVLGVVLPLTLVTVTLAGARWLVRD
jgi:magnesium transporter